MNRTFQKLLDESNPKSNKIWVDKGSEFYSKSMKTCSQDNDKEMYETHNERKSVVAEKFIRTLKNKIYKYMTSISRNVYVNRLDSTVDEYNNSCHKTIPMKAIDIK